MLCNKYLVSFLHILLCIFIGTTPFWSSPSIIVVSLFMCTVVLFSFYVNNGCIAAFMERELYNEDYVETPINFKRLWKGIDHRESGYKSHPIWTQMICFSSFILVGLISLYLTCNAKNTI